MGPPTPQLGHADEVKQNIIFTTLFLLLIYLRLVESVTIQTWPNYFTFEQRHFTGPQNMLQAKALNYYNEHLIRSLLIR